MEGDHSFGAGVKVTYIETRFVTADDAAGFKDLVQRLTGRSAAAAAPPPAQPVPVPHRPRRPRRADGAAVTAAAGAVPQGYLYHTAGEACRPAAAAAVGGRAAPQCLVELLDVDMGDFSGLFCVGASDHERYSDFPY